MGGDKSFLPGKKGVQDRGQRSETKIGRGGVTSQLDGTSNGAANKSVARAWQNFNDHHQQVQQLVELELEPEASTTDAALRDEFRRVQLDDTGRRPATKAVFARERPSPEKSRSSLRSTPVDAAETEPLNLMDATPDEIEMAATVASVSARNHKPATNSDSSWNTPTRRSTTFHHGRRLDASTLSEHNAFQHSSDRLDRVRAFVPTSPSQVSTIYEPTIREWEMESVTDEHQPSTKSTQPDLDDSPSLMEFD